MDAHPGSWTRWAVYENLLPAEAEGAMAALGDVDIVLFASGSAAHRWAALRGERRPRVGVIGPQTAEEARNAGLEVHGVAEGRSLEALADVALALARLSG
jgi:uroporphyrinogen-III synthase